MNNADEKLEVIVSCIDYRFWPEALSILEKKFHSFDLIELAGGAKNIVSPTHQFDKKAVLESIGVAIDLHGAKTLILINHVDCGAYGGSKKFASPKKEEIFHKKELLKAKQICRKIFPELKIKTFFLKKNSLGRVSVL